MSRILVVTLVVLLITVPHLGQTRPSAKQFEKIVKLSKEPLFVDGERVYRPNEVTQTAVVTFKPEPSLTDKAREKKTHGVVILRVIFRSSGEMKVLNVFKRLPHGLTDQAIGAAVRIKFEPALLDGKRVAQTILLEYHFNRY